MARRAPGNIGRVNPMSPVRMALAYFTDLVGFLLFNYYEYLLKLWMSGVAARPYFILVTPNNVAAVGIVINSPTNVFWTV